MPYFVDDYGDHAVFDGVRIGAVRIWSAVVEADHRVLHAVASFYGNGRRVRIVKSMGGVGLQGMCHYSCGILLPKWIAFLAVVGHGHHIFSALLNSHGIPDEFTGRGPGKVTDIVGFEYPGLLSWCFFLF